MDKIGLKRFFYFQFVSKDNVKDVFRLTLYKSKPNKLLIFNVLCKPLIIRVFAPKGKSDSKYSLIFRGISGNSDRKIRIRLQSETALCHSTFNGRKRRSCSDGNAAVIETSTRLKLNRCGNPHRRCLLHIPEPFL